MSGFFAAASEGSSKNWWVEPEGLRFESESMTLRILTEAVATFLGLSVMNLWVPNRVWSSGDSSGWIICNVGISSGISSSSEDSKK